MLSLDQLAPVFLLILGGLRIPLQQLGIGLDSAPQCFIGPGELTQGGDHLLKRFLLRRFGSEPSELSVPALQLSLLPNEVLRTVLELDMEVFRLIKFILKSVHRLLVIKKMLRNRQLIEFPSEFQKLLLSGIHGIPSIGCSFFKVGKHIKVRVSQRGESSVMLFDFRFLPLIGMFQFKVGTDLFQPLSSCLKLRSVGQACLHPLNLFTELLGFPDSFLGFIQLRFGGDDSSRFFEPFSGELGDRFELSFRLIKVDSPLHLTLRHFKEDRMMLQRRGDKLVKCEPIGFTKLFVDPRKIDDRSIPLTQLLHDFSASFQLPDIFSDSQSTIRFAPGFGFTLIDEGAKVSQERGFTDSIWTVDDVQGIAELLDDGELIRSETGSPSDGD
ncbi:MAG: hypothetical protein BWY50_00297 [Spirochaetes bacterium ADurb.Bin315]|nr:MAG: hypothetical protein BWY50_00297 [Spirochaetes bacterium ADurb.Bin315]